MTREFVKYFFVEFDYDEYGGSRIRGDDPTIKYIDDVCTENDLVKIEKDIYLCRDSSGELEILRFYRRKLPEEDRIKLSLSIDKISTVDINSIFSKKGFEEI